MKHIVFHKMTICSMTERKRSSEVSWELDKVNEVIIISEICLLISQKKNVTNVPDCILELLLNQ